MCRHDTANSVPLQNYALTIELLYTLFFCKGGKRKCELLVHLARLGNSTCIYRLNISKYHTVEFRDSENTVLNHFNKFYNCSCCLIVFMLYFLYTTILQGTTM